MLPLPQAEPSLLKGQSAEGAHHLAPHSPNMHEHIGEEAPCSGTVPRVVYKGALHVLRVVGLQHPLVEAGPVTQEHNNLQTQYSWSETGIFKAHGVAGGQPTWARVTEAMNTGGGQLRCL